MAAAAAAAAAARGWPALALQQMHERQQTLEALGLCIKQLLNTLRKNSESTRGAGSTGNCSTVHAPEKTNSVTDATVAAKAGSD